MEVINGWEIHRDGRGFWAVAGTLRIGPYPRKSQVQDFAAANTAPKPAPVSKRKMSTEDGE